VLKGAAADFHAELLGSADVAPGSGVGVKCTGLKSCEGEAVVNNRKNKVIAAYELAVVLGWEATGGGDGAEVVEGEIRLPYISEENHDEDPEIQVERVGCWVCWPCVCMGVYVVCQ
jgi:activator of HSP90 ATPase